MRRLLAFLLLATACSSGGPPATRPGPSDPPVIILVSIDGFRPDYLGRGVTPTLDSLARVGVRAEWMEPSFPSKTFPNHYTIVTGLRPDHHGIIANNIRDSVLGSFSMSNRAAVQEARWWGGEPVWVALEKAGRPASAMFWPGSEAAIGGVHATHWLPFDGRMPEADRVDSLLAWLDVPAARRPGLLTLYTAAVDNAGHAFGPGSPRLADSLALADAMVTRLVAGLRAHRLADRVNLLVVSDHGMAPVGPDRVIALDDYISLDDVTVNDWGPAVMLAPAPGRAAAVYAALRGAHPALDVYWKQDVPGRLEFGTHPRVPAIVAIAREGWTVTSRARIDRVTPGGNHGFDNALPSMRALFLASGPAFRRGVVLPAFPNVDVYPLMMHILGLEPAPNDGSLEPLRAALRP
ncbi:MAG: alkaline phosphatase family protein [Gemmatimonadetes bacterium]|nr:alkaline phosphatase family protein [Gemmatimonadota bacterium]MCB9504549.1 alkaline phosphatase family protein [Gemmatimonadales bacterium]MCA9761731.1 alkaline phosphatase family protein [Gemmatimonadota bacterium]MCB9518122.1 alkaline phosphatase family protein [Gemmatimonadales bacterium]HPF60731.1 ectonucleotide pyrophosphatase/phosphodiesterase [Gemmatimonadales bacterium]